MKAVFVLSETDVKQWVTEAVQEYFQNVKPQIGDADHKEGNFISRKEIAGILSISLVTLTDWMKRGLPYHKQRGRVYFIKTEVFDYIMKTDPLKEKLLIKKIGLK